VTKVLTSKVELAPAGKILRGITKKDQLVVEIPQKDVADKIPVDSRSRMTN
jgi:hypothetical protein